MSGVWIRREDGEWEEIGEAVSVTFAAGDPLLSAGACPECRTRPLNDEPVICEHGVTVRRT